MTRTRLQRIRQSGHTLPELMVTVLILTLILGSTTAAFLAVNKTSSAVDNRIENLGQAQLLIRTASKDIRTATPLEDGRIPAFTLATPWRIEFYAFLNTSASSVTSTAVPKKVTLYVDRTTDPKNPTLVELSSEPKLTGTPPLWTSAAPVYLAPTLRYVGQYITNTQNTAGTTPVFAFFDKNGAEILYPASPPAAKYSDGTPMLATTQLDDIYSVRVKLIVRKFKRADVKGTAVENQVRLPNVIYNPISSAT